jgi:hypothetical protein
MKKKKVGGQLDHGQMGRRASGSRASGSAPKKKNKPKIIANFLFPFYFFDAKINIYDPLI